MKNIEFIDDKSIRVDGVLFTSSPVGNPVPEPKTETTFKEKTWVCYVVYDDEKRPFFITRFDKEKVYGKWDYFNGGLSELEDYICYITDLVTVTNEEIEAHLTRIAKDKGLMKDGAKLKSPSGGIFHFDSDNNTVYYQQDDSLSNRGMWLYHEGEWATIIPEKKKLPKTKEEFVLFLQGVLIEAPTGYDTKISLWAESFLQDYED